MSGLAGFVHFDGRPAEVAHLQRMTQAMAYRGPHGIHHRVWGSAALGHCMLTATGEGIGEPQPLHHASSQATVVWDGRLDNRSELATQLGAPEEASDAEWVLLAYERWGSACAEHLEGDFAFAVWDERRRTLFCARDPMGHKPFHFHWDGRTLSFASDVHAVLQLPWVAERMNEGYLAELLAMDLVSVDETLWQGVCRLPSAHALMVDTSGPKGREYWTPDLGATLACRTEEEFADYQRALLFDVVRRTSRSRLPVGFEVSGGLDSSALFAVGYRLLAQGSLAAPALHGYALAFDDAHADESAYRRALEAHVGTAVLEVPPATCSLDGCRDFARANKAFLGFPNGVMMGSLYEAARADGSRVIVGGIGGDEWLQTMQDWRCTALMDREWRLLARSLRPHGGGIPLVAAAYGLLRYGLLPFTPEIVKDVLRPWRRGNSTLSWLPPELRRLLVQRKEEARRTRPSDKGVSRIHAAQLAQWRDPWHALVREFNERHAAHFGMERRDPFWSQRVVQAAFATPERLRGKGGQSKWLHRQAMRGLLPETILERDDKADFFVVFQPHHDAMRRAVAEVAPRRRNWVRGARGPASLRGGHSDEERSIIGDLAAWSLVMADVMTESPRADAPLRDPGFGNC